MKKTKTKTPPRKTNFRLELSVLTAVIAFLSGSISNFGLAVPNMTFRIVETIGIMNDMIFTAKPFGLRAVVSADIINFGLTSPEITFRITITIEIKVIGMEIIKMITAITRLMVPFLAMPKKILPS